LQAGASGAGTGYTHEIRTRIEQPGSFIYGADARTYWSYVTFPDGQFFQAGFVDSDNGWGSDKCSTGFATFVTALYGSTNLFSDLYHIQHCNITGGHWFRLVRSYTSTQTVWQWLLDGTSNLGPALEFDNFANQDFQKRNAGFASEIVHEGTIASGQAFPTVDYSTAIQFRDSSGNWVDAANGVAWFSSDRTCEYAIKSPSANHAVTGRSSAINPPQCYGTGDSLW